MVDSTAYLSADSMADLNPDLLSVDLMADLIGYSIGDLIDYC